MAGPDTLSDLVEPVVTGLGYELVGLQLARSRGSALLRVYIDHPDGISLEDCARVSRQISGVLDVEDPLPEQYTLEVSSPGLDRPLFKAADYQRFAGERIHLRISGIIAGRRRLHGLLRGLDGEEVLVEEEDGTLYRVPLARVEKAHLELEP